MGVTLLAYLLAAMLAISGALKVRSGGRLGVGVLPGTIVELLAAVGFAAAPLLALDLPVWSMVAAIAILIVSSAHHGAVLRSIRRRREASEGGRLAAYVRYLSQTDPPTGSGSEPER